MDSLNITEIYQEQSYDDLKDLEFRWDGLDAYNVNKHKGNSGLYEDSIESICSPTRGSYSTTPTSAASTPSSTRTPATGGGYSTPSTPAPAPSTPSTPAPSTPSTPSGGGGGYGGGY